MGQAMYARAQQQTSAEDRPPTEHTPDQDEGVVDAEIVDEDRDRSTKDTP